MLTTDEGLYRVRHGVADVVQRLTGGMAQVLCDSRVRSATACEQGVRIQLESGAVMEMDHLIIATQANAASQMLPRRFQ